jgi:hypothetical protein
MGSMSPERGGFLLSILPRWQAHTGRKQRNYLVGYGERQGRLDVARVL